MNQYGRQARTWWQMYRPQAFAELTDPDKYFTDLGQQAETMVNTLSMDIEAKWKVNSRDDFWERLGLMNNARRSAEETVMDQLVYELPKEIDPIDDEDDDPNWISPAQEAWLEYLEWEEAETVKEDQATAKQIRAMLAQQTD